MIFGATQSFWSQSPDQGNAEVPPLRPSRLLGEQELGPFIQAMQKADLEKVQDQQKYGVGVTLDTRNYGRGKRVREVNDSTCVFRILRLNLRTGWV